MDQEERDQVKKIEQGQNMKDVITASLAPHGVIRAAINMSNFLLVSGQTESGQPDGLSPDVANELARRLGVFCELIPFEGPGLLADAAGCDIWDIGNIAVEPERAEVIDFSQPYIQIDANFMTREGSTLANNTDVNKQGVEVVLYKRSAYDLWLKDNYTAPTYLRVGSINESVTAFEEGQGDVLACLKPKLMAVRSDQPNYRIIDPPFTAIRQAIGLNKGHPEALGFVNETIADLLANGFVADSLKRHGVGNKLSLPS
jgi:polar amino acid transport system substrate-binding protein